MRLILAVGLVLCAFAANSVLNRLALAGGAIGPGAFAAVRLGSGALALGSLVALRGRRAGTPGWARLWGAGWLLVYMLGFSYAYVTLPAGIGALILFGTVQLTMFAGAVIGGQDVPGRRWAGVAIAFAGLTGFLWPLGGLAVGPDPAGAALMAVAGLGWGVYSLAGRSEADPLAATAGNFLLAAPVAVGLALLHPDAQAVSAVGLGYGVVAGVITSGLGYALWYRVLPQIPATAAAVAQLLVPILAALGGALLLGEVPSARLLVTGAVVLGGVAFSLTHPAGGKARRG